MMADRRGRPPQKGQDHLAIPVDFGTPERARHGGVEIVPMKPKTGRDVEVVARVRHEHPLDVYLRRAQITDRQHAAGIKFRSLWERAIGDTVTSAYSELIAGLRGGGDGEGAAIARARVNQVLAALENDRQRLVLIGVCAYAEFATVAFENNKIPVSMVRSVSVLKDALKSAADYWGLSDDPSPETASNG